MASEIIIGSAVLIVVGLLLTSNLYLRIKNKGLILKASQAEIDRLSVYVKTQELLAKAAEESNGSDGFIKFMSQSRDWAFEYIEAVQKDLEELKLVFESSDGKPKTVAQTNTLAEAVRKVLTHLPGDKEKDV